MFACEYVHVSVCLCHVNEQYELKRVCVRAGVMYVRVFPLTLLCTRMCMRLCVSNFLYS